MSKDSTALKGLDEVVSGLNKGIAEIGECAFRAFIKISILLKNEMIKTSPTIPLDTGNLRHSYFTLTIRGSESNPAFVGDDVRDMATNHEQALAEALANVQQYQYPTMCIGFSANYALAVHEMKTKDGGDINWKEPGSGPKFFEKALLRNKGKILSIIAEEAKLK